MIIMNVLSNLTDYDKFGIMITNYNRYAEELNENSIVNKIVECACKT